MTVRMNHLDGQREEERLGKEEWQLRKKLKALCAQRRVLKKIIAGNDDGERHWILTVPVNALAQRNITTRPVNWKMLVLTMFDRYKIPMTTEMVCNKLWLHFAEVPFNRKTVMQNVSAALSVLEGKEQRLFRTRQKIKKGFVYGLKHFFDFNFNLKPDYWQQYRREEGDSEQVIRKMTEQAKKIKQMAI